MAICHCLCIVTLGYFFSTWWMMGFTTWSSAHWDDFLSLAPFRVTLELSCSETKLCFLLIPIYRNKPSVDQA